MKRFALIYCLLMVGAAAGAQIDTPLRRLDTVSGRVYVLQKIKRNGEVLPEVQIKEVTIVGRGEAQRRSYFRKYERLVYNIKKVYPYAILVRRKLEEVNNGLSSISSEKERKQYLKDVEKTVFAEYEDDMRNMTITQGKILLKLIDRETANTSFELIKEYRGGISAAFWQGIARIFGTNLKEEYDPYGNDIVLELIIADIEAGLL